MPGYPVFGELTQILEHMPSSHRVQEGPYDVRREPFPFQEPRKPSPANLRIERLHRPKLLLSCFARGIALIFRRDRLQEGLLDDHPVDAFLFQFLFDPAFANTAIPNAARCPLGSEPRIVEIAEPGAVVDDSCYDAVGKFFFPELGFQLFSAPGAIRKQTVRGIPRPRLFLVLYFSHSSSHRVPASVLLVPEAVDLEIAVRGTWLILPRLTLLRRGTGSWF